ncbi:MAG: cation-transporting p-type atpase, partial [Promethearchaeota archaeon CR_4]
MSGYSNLQNEPEKKWFSLPFDDVERKFDSSINQGLSSTEAQGRLVKYGPNTLLKEKKRSRILDFLDEFTDPLVIILIIAAVVSVLVTVFGEGETDFTDAIVIGVIVILNAIIGFVQEGKADAAIDALRKISAPEAIVIRDGREIRIKAADIVPGDIITVQEGDRIPADGRLFEASNLKCEEAALTGESVPVSKHANLITDPEVALADCKNMLYASTLITFGRG